MNSQMTERTRGGKCGPRTGGLRPAGCGSFAASTPSWCSRAARASDPNPIPACCRNRRRDGRGRCGVSLVMGCPRPGWLVDVDELVEAQQNLAEVSQGHVGGPGALAVALGLALDERQH